MPKSNGKQANNIFGGNGMGTMMQPNMSLVTSMFAPMLAANITMLNWNARNCEKLAQVYQQWFQFLGHRLDQDATFAEEMQKVKDPEEIAKVCSTFVEKAAKDYQDELSELTKISGEFSNQMTDAIQDLSTPPAAGAVMGE